MKNLNRKLAIVGLILLAAISAKLYAATPKNPQPQVWSPGCVATVPKSWGQFRGGSTQTGLAFEDNAGTLRFLTGIPCGGTPVPALEIHRIADGPNSTGN